MIKQNRRIQLSIIFLIIVSLFIISACSSDSTKELTSEGDLEACEIYEATVAAATDESITDDKMLEELEEAYFAAENDELVDLIDDLLIYLEEDGDYGIDLQQTVDKIRSFCLLD